MLRPNLIIGLAYFVAGKLALLLAIPPGYATAVWPAAGLALVAVLVWGPRVCPGIALGSLAANVVAAGDGRSWLELGHALAIAAAIGLGAAAQAWVGARLVRRAVAFPTLLASEREIALILALGGPAASLINATAGSLLLRAGGVVDWIQVPFTWWTWWVGDTVGVLVVLPIALLALAEPRRAWRARWAVVALPLISCFVLVVAGFIYASRREVDRQREEFRAGATYMAAALESVLAADLEIVRSVRRFAGIVPAIDQQAFASFTSRITERQLGIEALAWVPRVRQDERAAFERAALAAGFTAFAIRERAPDGSLVAAAERAEYFPLHLVNPLDPFARAVGFDLGSEAVRREALERARDGGAIAATARLRLVIDAEGPFGVALFAPVYAGATVPPTIAERRRELRGFVLAVFRVRNLVNEVLAAHGAPGTWLSLVDRSTAEEPAVLAVFRGERAVAEDAAVPEPLLVRTLEVGGRTWELRLAPTQQYLASRRSWSAWAVLAAGMLFTSLLGAFLLAVAGRTVATARLVHERTEALARSEWYLRQILKTASDAFVAIDERGRIVQWNPRAEQLFGWKAEEVEDRPLAETIIPQHHREAHGRGMAHFLATGHGPMLDRIVELEAVHRDGRVFPVELAISAARVGGEWRFQGFLRDVSQRKDAQRQLLASLSEKELLLSEIRDRSASDLALVSTLVGLPRGASEPERVAAQRKRLATIEAMHARLYQSSDLARPGFAAFLRALVPDVQQRCPGAAAVRVEVVGDPVAPRLDVMVACGLMFSELVENALAHAFPDGRAGTVLVDVRRRGEAQLELTVSDDGVGVAVEREPREAPTLGWQLVASVAERFGGSFEVQRRGGTVARVVLAI